MNASQVPVRLYHYQSACHNMQIDRIHAYLYQFKPQPNYVYGIPLTCSAELIRPCGEESINNIRTGIYTYG